MLTIQMKDIFELSKYTDILKSDIKVMTPSGLKKIYDVDITAYNSDVIIIKTHKHELMCSPDHLIKSNNNWIKSKNFKINDPIDTKYGTFNVKEISVFDKKEDLLDLHVDGNEYYTNDILSHNSSLQETIDFSLFGVVRGKERKRIPMKELPNRINGSLLTKVLFTNDNEDDITIERGLEPVKLKIMSNSHDITSRYKKFSNDQKDELIGINYDIYKSFISMSLNDFTNFINLDPETKRKLLNRLFNIEEIDNYFQISKNIVKNNKRNIENKKIELSSNLRTIETYKENIENIKKLSNDSIGTKEEIKEKILSKRSRFTELKEHLTDIIGLINESSEDLGNRSEVLNSKHHRVNKIDYKIEDIKEKIKIFEKGVCPMCNTVLKSDKHIHNLSELILEKETFEKEKSELSNDVFSYKKESRDVWSNKNKLVNEKDSIKKEFNELGFELKTLKKEYDTHDTNYNAVKEIENNIENITNENKKIKEIISELENKNSRYEKLNELFSNQGIRKDIIENIVKPINNYLSEYLEELDSPYRVELNDQFDAEIYERYINQIHPESLSSGEARKVNIAIALSYLEIIRKMRKSNILFLDEIFENVDEDNIDILLKTLKKFSIKYKTNVVVINHSPTDKDLFDRIIKIEKKTFSMISDI